MDTRTATTLSDLTTDFYARQSSSFDATRQHPWPGWEHVLGSVRLPRGRATRLLDLACGNLRFERFVSQHADGLDVWAVDNCDALSSNAVANSAHTMRLHYQHLDLSRSPQDVVAPTCDLCVSFAFMHHLPLPEQRAALLSVLVDHALPHGFVAVSFWQFERDERIRAKAVPLADKGDYLLGWQNETDVARFCHSFDEAEIDELVAHVALSAREVARFSSDGRRGDLNRYLVLQKMPS